MIDPTSPTPRPTRRHRRNRLLMSLLLLVCVVALEWWSNLDYSLGIFYVFSIVVMATVVERWQVILGAVACAWIRGYFTPNLAPIEFWLRFAMALLAYVGIGLLVVEMSRNRRVTLASLAKLKLEEGLRLAAESQLRTLVDSSPAGIVTLDGRGYVVAANRAAHELLGFEPASLIGCRLVEHVPVFAGALAVSQGDRSMRTAASSWAKRSNGVTFPVATWFSTYREAGELYLAGILVDVSEEVRERERESLRQVGDYNRLLAGTVSHEIRNLCSAIRVVTANLGERKELASDSDFDALTSLVESLSRIASFELRNSTTQTVTRVSLDTVLEQLRVVIEPDWNDLGGTIRWVLGSGNAHVHADEHGLLQVFLNLAQNSLRVVQPLAEPVLEVTVREAGDQVTVSFIDNGSGVADPSTLFQPFRPDADGSGLGLYISRALVRSFGGEVTFVPTGAGCRFDVTLPVEAPPS